jgi:hypothetical protein
MTPRNWNRCRLEAAPVARECHHCGREEMLDRLAAKGDGCPRAGKRWGAHRARYVDADGRISARVVLICDDCAHAGVEDGAGYRLVADEVEP